MPGLLKMAFTQPGSDHDFAEDVNTKQYADFHGHKVKKYDLKLSTVPRLHVNDPQVEELIKNEVSWFSTHESSP